MDQRSSSAAGSFRPRQSLRWLRLRVCDVLKVFNVGKYVQVFDWIFVRVEFYTLSGLNVSGCAANIQILLACNLKVFSMVYCDMVKSPAVWGEYHSEWKFRATARGRLWHCRRHARSGVHTVDRDESWSWAWATLCVSWWYFQLTCWASTSSQGESLHAGSCKNAAWSLLHNTINKLNPIKIKPVENP